MPGEDRGRFRYADAALLRAVAVPDGFTVGSWPDLDGSADAEHLRSWLALAWGWEGVAAGVEVASPGLARRVEAVCAGECPPVREMRGLACSLARYLLRMTGRATPFGLFAGVAAVRIGPDPVVRFGAGHAAVARVDATWLAGVIAALESCPAVLARLPVVLSDLCFVRGDRLVMPSQASLAQGRPSGRPAEISVRRTTAVELIMREAVVPVQCGELAGKLAAEFPGTPRAVIAGTLADLVSSGMLVSGLRPPMTAADPLGHVLAALDVAGVGDIGEARGTVRELREISRMFSWHNLARSPRVARDDRAALARRMTALSGAAGQPLMVDLRLDCDVTLPAQVAREAETAAWALAHLTSHPAGVSAWQDFHLRFLERYGTDCLVPVRVLTDADAGLGLPAGYLGSWRQPASPRLTARDHRLIALAQMAAIEGAGEAVLSERDITGLWSGSAGQAGLPPHAELVFQIEAPSPAALADGDFRLVVTGTSRSAGAMTGRFLGLLGQPDRARMMAVYAGLAGHRGAIPVQVSAPPLYLRAENVSRAPAVLPHQISLAQHLDGDDGGRYQVVPLSDVAVASDGQRLSVWSISRRCEIDPVVFHALDLRSHAHQLVRFLCEAGRAQAAVYVTFDWGAATQMPFLPRLRYGRVVLAPARWNLTAADLPARAAPWPEWASAFAEIRRGRRVPVQVYLCERDRRLRLDLDVACHQVLLREHLDRAGVAEVREAPAEGAHGWLAGRAHEIVLPLTAARDVATPGSRPRALPVRVASGDHGYLPGASAWLYAKLYAHPDRYDELLTARLPALWEGWEGGQPDWWFIRYRDPEPHLRLRIPVTGAGGYGQAARRLGSWAVDQRRSGLLRGLRLDTYYPEIGRYGTGPALRAAHAVFAADTQAVLAQLAMAHGGAVHPDAITAASLADIAVGFTGGIASGMRWLAGQGKTGTAAPAPRGLYREAIQLADPGDGWAAIRARPGGELVAGSWIRRRGVLACYHARLSEAGHQATDQVLSLLQHMHHVRMSGAGHDSELACHRLARAAARAFRARNTSAQP